ncbi:hypothetical protein CK936_10115 [Streptomyces albireticuli]|uniref:Uncharacterized protein n=1 Tax=Streptomyces albireticuli TaxID=1940 RepID=A0A2A2DCE6_9ACTN|nr:hypothetical protein CK936_10115 [Streptomyces albireticuli]
MYPELKGRTAWHAGGGLQRALSVFLLITGCVLLGIGAWFLARVPAAVDRTEGFRDARACAADTAPRPGEDCVRGFPATVAEVHTSKRKNDTSWIRFSDYALPSGKVTFRGEDDATAEQWRPGDRATVSVWHGDVVTLTVGDERLRVGTVRIDGLAYGTAAMCGLAGGVICLLYGGFGLAMGRRDGCTPGNKNDVLRPVAVTAGCWVVLPWPVVELLGLPICMTAALWLAGAAFTLRAAGNAVYRYRLDARPGEDPAAHSPRLDRLFGERGGLLPWKRHDTSAEEAGIAEGRRVEFPGSLPGDTRFSARHSPVTILGLEGGSLYAAPAGHMGKLAKRVPLEEYRLAGVRRLHPSVGSDGKRTDQRRWHVAEFEPADGDSERLYVATEPYRLRRILRLMA